MAHIHDRIDMVATALIVNKGRVLLRLHDKYNTWLGVGGHIELDEDPNQAVIRECKEEVGLDVKLISPRRENYPQTDNTPLVAPFFLNRHWINETHEHVDLLYVAVSETDKVNPGEGETKDGIKWFTLEELEANKEIRDIVKYYAKEALKTVTGQS